MTDTLPVDDATYDGVVSGHPTWAAGLGRLANCAWRKQAVYRDFRPMNIWRALHFERALDAMADHYDTLGPRCGDLWG